jgi:predicted pyridoxine 5'-phosphate oxidase superfamily flavin-nucleotide-binding protein
MIELTEQMREAVNNALAEGVPMVIATASKDGRPDLAFKGSTMVFDSEHLAYWERSFGETLANVQQNPHVCLLYRSRERGVAWRFYGVAAIHAEGELRQQVMERVVQPELDRDPERKGIAVLVRVDRVVQGREVIMRRDEE